MTNYIFLLLEIDNNRFNSCNDVIKYLNVQSTELLCSVQMYRSNIHSFGHGTRCLCDDNNIICHRYTNIINLIIPIFVQYLCIHIYSFYGHPVVIDNGLGDRESTSMSLIIIKISWNIHQTLPNIINHFILFLHVKMQISNNIFLVRLWAMHTA